MSPLRASLVATLMAIVVTTSGWVGPRISGTIALFPIVFTAMILILHPRIGGSPTAALIANGAWGMIGYGTAVAALHVAAQRYGSTKPRTPDVCLLESGLLVDRTVAACAVIGPRSGSNNSDDEEDNKTLLASNIKEMANQIKRGQATCEMLLRTVRSHVAARRFGSATGPGLALLSAGIWVAGGPNG